MEFFIAGIIDELSNYQFRKQVSAPYSGKDGACNQTWREFLLVLTSNKEGAGSDV
jgi:hypothetical protein